jgi:hypothetical protein
MLQGVRQPFTIGSAQSYVGTHLVMLGNKHVDPTKPGPTVVSNGLAVFLCFISSTQTTSTPLPASRREWLTDHRIGHVRMVRPQCSPTIHQLSSPPSRLPCPTLGKRCLRHMEYALVSSTSFLTYLVVPLDHFDVLELVFWVWDLVFLTSDMGHLSSNKAFGLLT